MLTIDYFKKINCPIKKELLEKTVKFFSSETKCKFIAAEVAIIGDNEMKRLNYQYRGRNKTTDVLSFAFREDKKIKTDFLGQIFISYQQIKKQAKEYGVPIKEEFVRMLAHGLLHLTGYDHNTKTKEKKMFEIQEKIVKKTLL
ncbi:MAG TPA: rRNA maturation RNase YbeY [Candidatus Magasanikbacteria bacterium]|nr:rRNA maturation RNase YbeY [Candidatus Magasanikbacteria bacterium]